MKKIHFPTIRIAQGAKTSAVISVTAGLVVAAILLNLGLTRFTVRAYIAEDAQAVPMGALTSLLQSEKGEGSVELLPVSMGDAIYVNSLHSDNLFIGDEKEGINGGYPLYARSGNVLYFLDDTLDLVTADWNTLSTYDGLYESNGVTFNADSSQADIDEILLVQVTGGYAVAQPSVATVAQRDTDIPMNSVCSFRTDRIVYFSLDKDTLRGDSVQMPEGSAITIGDHTYLYRDFLEKIGVWEETSERNQPIQAEEEEQVIPEEEEEKQQNPGSGGQDTDTVSSDTGAAMPGEGSVRRPLRDNESGERDELSGSDAGNSDTIDDTNGDTNESDWGEETDQASDEADQIDETDEKDDSVERERRPSQLSGNITNRPRPASTTSSEGGGAASRGSDVFEQPGPAIRNPENDRERPPKTERVKEDKNPDYVEPTVAFGNTLTPWVYTVGVEATIEDPADRIDRGVQIFMYKVENSAEKLGPRRAVSSSGDVELGQLDPGSTYHFVAQYTYYDKLNYPRTETIDIGTATTLSFDEIGEILLHVRDESENAEYGLDTQVMVFSQSLQLRDVTLANIQNGIAVEPDGTQAAVTDVKKAESYITNFTVDAVSRTDNTTTSLKMDSAALRLLRGGYTLIHWETPDKLATGTYYDYVIRLYDRSGNEFSVTYVDSHGNVISRDDANPYSGHTCRKEPTVEIEIPNSTNVEGSTRLDVTWRNVEGVPVSENTGSSALEGLGVAALYIVRQGDEVKPENAINLVATQPGGSAVTNAKYLPIGTANATVNTSWVVTNLTSMRQYVAAVVCGYYDIDDGRNHYNETLKETTQFLTASLSNLGTIPYGWNVDNVWYDAARLNLRMLYNPSGRYFNPRLLNLVSSAELEVKNAAGVSLGTVVLSRDLLRTIPLSSAQYISADAATGLRRFDVSAPVQWNDEDEPRVTVMSLLYDEQPAYVDADGNTATPSTVWDYLLATSGTGEDCWLSLQLGSLFEDGETRLMALEPKSDYTGTLRFYANQGDGEKQNVTSVTSKDIAFSTISRDAVVHFDNAFISSTFIELIHLRIADPDECVMPDESERDGNNVLVEILDSTGYRVASTYINSKREYETFRLTGLTNNETYTLRFHPPRYTNQGLVSLTKYLDIAVADIVDEANPTEFRFVTGASVSGSLALNSLEQYYAPDQLGEADQTQLGLLSDDDFYDGVWANEGNYYYTNSELKNEQFVDLVDEKERDLDETLKAQLKGMTGTYNATSMPLTLSHNSSYSSNAWRNYSWTTRMIAVQPGELYSLFNCNPTTNFRIHFFFVNSNGMIQYTSVRKYNDITSYYYGNVFEVPDRSDYQTATQTNVCFMRISGYTDKGRQGIVLERYDPERTKNLPDMAQGSDLQFGSSFSSNGTIAAASGGHGFGYTVDYIPVTGGSVYELIGRDENLRDYEGGRRNPVNDTMLSASYFIFYDASYRYLGCFTVGNQVALVKAPYGAVYCRFNVRTNTLSGTTDYFNSDELTMKEYRAAITDKYIGTVELELADASDEQILNGGSYTVRLYQTASAVAESVNLSAYTHWEYLSSYDRTEVLYSSSTNKLNKKELLRPYPNLPANRGFRAVLSVRPAGWNFEIPLDTLYFNTVRKVRTISNLADLYSILNDPAGSYIVTADISGVGRQILDATRPFSGTIDFQGHKITMTTADPLFDRINANGIVRNLELTHRYRDTTKNASAKANSGSLALNNYGTIENVVLNYDIYYQWAPYERSGGGIVYLNYGTIDGFVVNFRQDLRTLGYFGGVAYGNGGTIRNGYITGEVQENGRRAGIVSVNPRITYTKQSENVYTNSKSTSGDAGYLGYCVGANYLRGTVENVFVVTDQLTIQSSDVEKDNDLTSGDASATNTYRSAVLVGSSNGAIRNCFVVGDRVDQKATLEVDQDVYTVVDERVMDARGPVVGYVDYLYVADNLTYFSPRNASYKTMTDDYNKTTSDTTYVHVGDYNQKGDPRSLYDYKWYEGVLGADGDRFIIRDNLERGNGYYPQLILPDCFADDAQPLLPLLGQSTDTVRILDHTVRMIGKDAEGNQQALVTITINNPRNRAVTDFVITDSNENNGKALSCEVLGQRSLNGTCRVDVLLGIGTAKAADEYTIHQVKMESTLYNAELTDERVIFVSFWNEIWNASEYITKLSENRTLNYRLAADLDFSQSRTSNDWYLSSAFFGKLDGGIYAYEEQPLLSDAGDPILAEGTENMRTMFVQGELIGMHTISGIGNVTVSGSVSNDRYNTDYKGALFRTLYGTLENIVFSNFVTRSSGTAGAKAVNSASSGVVIDMNGTAVIDNCHVRDSVFSGRGYVGPLVANMEYGTITNCSARNVEVVGYRTRTGTDTLWVGGLVGRGNKGTIRGCFAADVTITAPDVYSVDGIGGVVGGISDGVLLESCYSTGSIEANCSRVGGIVGHLRGSGSKTVGCWSTATVVTTSDYAGSIVGYYEAGIMTNNYALGTVLSRASSTSNVHRVASNITFDELNSHDNYAYVNQYLTYARDDGTYAFGTTEELDGATALISESETRQTDVWINQIGVDTACFDLNGSAPVSNEYDGAAEGASGGVAAGGGTVATGVAGGYLPKLMNHYTGSLLYDQPDVIANAGNTVTIMLATDTTPVSVDRANERMDVTLWIFTERDDAEFSAAAKDFVARWADMSVIGGYADPASVTVLPETIRTDAQPNAGRVVKVSIYYGEAATTRTKDFETGKVTGRYLDKYILFLPVYTDASRGATETVQISITPIENGVESALYKDIVNLETWNRFFDPTAGHDRSYENVRIATNELDLSGTDSQGKAAYLNVYVNRVIGNNTVGDSNTLVKGLSVDDSSTGYRIFTQVATEISYLDFEDISLKAGTNSTGNRGVAGVVRGDAHHLNFKNVTIDAYSGSNAGMIGNLVGKGYNVAVDGCTVYSVGGGNYRGCFVGYASGTATITNVFVKNCGILPTPKYSAGKHSTGNYCGGVIGELDGIASDLTVINTTVYGRETAGGAVGYANSNGGRPQYAKLENIYVGCTKEEYESGYASYTSYDTTKGTVNADSTVPGVLRYNDNGANDGKEAYSVLVTSNPEAVNANGVSEVAYRYFGGAVGRGGGQQIRGVHVYNARVQIPNKNSDDTEAYTYVYGMGGVTGIEGTGVMNSDVENCTMYCYGGRVGGVSGNSGVSVNCTARECVITAKSANSGWYAGGLCGSGYATRGTVQHCVVSGYSCVGGATGSKGGDCYDSAVTDTIVIGYTQVGGFHGQSWNNYVRRNSVTASQDPNGNPTVTTEVTAEMLNDWVISKAGSYTGVYVYGNDRVGGLVGNMNDYDVAYCYVGNNVRVEGVESVGGLCGQVYGWYSGRWETNNRMVYQCGTGADVVGTRYVGGFIGRWYLNPYDPELKNPSNATCLNPRGGYEYALLFTGTIRGEEETTGWLVGACRNGNDESYTLTLNSDKRDGDTPTYGYYFQYCRIWEGSTMKVGTNPARSANHADYGFVYYYDALRNKTATERNQTTNAYSYLATMLVTAADLSDRNLYFTSRDYTWIGMGWDREYFDMWNNGSVATLFPHDDGVVGADFASYQAGIQQNGLVLWLDGRNNEGKGGTAKDATTWKDLTGNGYDAVLYWNNKSYDDAANQITVKERNYNMYWQDGGLEWCTDDKGYYAKLGNNADPDKNLSAVLNDGNYTVELVCTYRYNYTGLDRGILSWRRATTYGGFNAKYGYNADNDNASSIVYLNGTSASAQWLGRYTAAAANIQRNDMYGRQETYERSMAYVVDTSGQNEALGRTAANQLRFAAYYMNGRLVAGTTSSIPTVSFPAAADNAFWYLGAGSQSASGVRLLGVRVYDRVLTKEEIAQNAAYDKWYYFGKALDSAYSTGTTSRGDTGLWTSGGTLFRSSEYGYSGEWVEDNFTGDPTGYGRGYYYVRSGSEDSYSYSDIKTVTSPNYAPQLNRLAYGSDWYTKERVMQFPGQEGETTGDVLYSTSDNKNQGGYRMPDCDMPYSANELTAITQKPVLQMMGMARRRTLSAAPPLPQVTAYASGADRVNLELLADPAQGLAYRVIVDDDEVLAGAWPADSRTITMTWDYNRSFTLELTQNGTSEEHVFNYNDLARTVMTYGGGYWYLYGSECYDSAGKSLDPDTAFVHMLNGKVLDEGGGVHNAATGALTGTVTPYQLVTTEPVWSGRLALDGMGGDDAEGSVPVECFATYFVSTGGAKNTQLVVKGDTVYTMPASDVKIGSFVVDSYASSFYTTWLGSNGDLVDGGTPLTYPEDFGASNIRETSNTLGYDGHIMLVRYKSGKLVAFNYLSGEPEDVLSSEAEAQSLMDYVADTLKGLGGRGLLSSVSAPALRALTYENEVASNSSLRTALAGLSANENNTAFIDGPGTGVYGDAPGGLDIEPTNLDGTEEADGEGTVVSGQSAAPSDSDAVTDADSSGTMLGDGEDGGQGEIAVNGTSTAIGTGKGSGTGAEEVNAGAESAAAAAEEANAETESAAAAAEEANAEAESAAAAAEETSAETESAAAAAEEANAETESAAAAAEEANAETESAAATAEETSAETESAAAEAGNANPEAESADATANHPKDRVGNDDAPAEDDGAANGAESFRDRRENTADKATGESADSSADSTAAQDAADLEESQIILEKSTQASAIRTRYVSMYNAETGTSAVYDLKELLTEPEESLVSQEERAEQLEELGFHTTLSTRITPAEEHANGLWLMLLVAVAMVALLSTMATIRRRRFDEPEK